MSYGPCSFNGCKNTAVSRGMCQPHSEQKSRGQEMTPLRHILPSDLRMDNQGKKWCSYCERYQELKEFGLLHGKPRSRCAICERAAKHHISREHFDKLLTDQEGRCGLCQGEAKRLLIDHNHKCCPGVYSCGKCVRNLLCDNCNQSLGGFKESPDLLRAAIRYIEEHNAG